MAGRTFSGEDVAGSWDSNTGNLFRVDPDTGSADTVDLGGEVLPGPDGLEMRENTLYVVGGGMVTVVRLGARLASGVVLGGITDPDLDVPTTATVAAGRLWVVNARFTTPPTPATDTGSPSCRCAQKAAESPRLPAIRQALLVSLTGTGCLP